MQREEILEALRQFKRDYAERYGILELGVFGSVARNEAGESSDLDICVRTRTPNPFLLVHIKDDIEALVHRRVDIVRLRDRMNPLLRERIEKEARYV